ncbi:MAG: hypothetical protein SFV15_17995 [Polyangiaceae bacterium]|nr:hypothetical protein [Polyangiaceae bacterium]
MATTEHNVPKGEQRSAPKGHAGPLLELSPLVLKLTAGAAVLASLAGKGVSAALPGARQGIERWISLSDFVGAWATQFFAVLGIVLAIQLMTQSLGTSRLPLIYRLAVAPMAGFAVFLCVAATQKQLPELLLLVLGLTTSFVAFFAAALAVTQAPTRLLGLALGLSAFSTIARLFGSLGDILPWGSAPKHPSAVLSILSLSASIGVLLVAAGMLNPIRRRANAGLFLAALLLGAVIYFAAESAQHSDASFFQVLVQRSLDNLQPNSTPWGDARVSRMLTSLVLPFSLALLLAETPKEPLAAAVSLALLARGAADIPVFGLQLLVAALIAPLAVVYLSNKTRANANAITH